jgi:nuclear GTP-binding protein
VAVEKGLKILDSPGIVWGDFMSGSEDGGVSVGSLNMIGIDAMDDPAFAGRKFTIASLYAFR